MAPTVDNRQIIQSGLNSVNTLAGAQLLGKNQQQWHKMHCKSEQNVAKVKLATAKFDNICNDVVQRKHALEQLLDCVKGLKNIKASIGEVSRDIDVLLSQFDSIESNLTVLQDAKEQQDVIKFRENQERLLKDYVTEKNKEFDRTSQRMEREHQERVRDYEQKQETLMDERRRLHEQAFQKEMQRYLDSIRKM